MNKPSRLGFRVAPRAETHERLAERRAVLRFESILVACVIAFCIGFAAMDIAPRLVPHVSRILAALNAI